MRRQIGSVTGNVSLLTAGSIVLGDFSTPLRFARNDRAFCCPTACGGEGGTKYQRGKERDLRKEI